MIATILGRLAFFHQARGRVDQARKLYAAALKRGMKRPRHWKYYILLLLHEGDYEKAAELANRMSGLPALKKKHRATAYIYYAIAQWKLGDVDKAILVLERFQKEGENIHAMSTLGFLLIEKGDLEAAWAYNQRALEVDPKNAVILDSLGQISYRRGEADARAWFERALKERPYQVDSLYYLAAIQKEAGEVDNARQTLEKALAQPVSGVNTVSRAQMEALRDALQE